MRLVNQTRGTVVASDLKIADSFFTRLRGLLGTNELPEGEALMIRPCNNIHMFGMKYAIDVAFVSHSDEVLKTVPSLAPGRFASCRDAAYVLEMPCGTLLRSGTETGDFLKMADPASDL